MELRRCGEVGDWRKARVSGRRSTWSATESQLTWIASTDDDVYGLVLPRYSLNHWSVLDPLEIPRRSSLTVEHVELGDDLILILQISSCNV